MEEPVESSQDYEFTPSPRDNDVLHNTPDSPEYIPSSNIRSKRGRKRKKRDIDSEHSDNEDGRDNGYPEIQLFEYQWPLYGNTRIWYMLQEQVGQYLDIRGMQRRYPDLERRTVDVEEKKYLIESEIVTETQGNMGLVALVSDEVLELMEEEFPTKYKEYLENVSERQTQTAIEESMDDNKRLANSEVTQEPSNRNELIQIMVKDAMEYNKLSIDIKNNNQQRLVTTSNKIGFVPRPVMKPIARKRIGRYPVALLPGQYCDNIIRYTPEQLYQLPLSTVTSFPKFSTTS